IGFRYDTIDQLADTLVEVTIISKENAMGYMTRAFETVNTMYSNESNVEAVYQFYKEIITEKC
ncbi:MAG: hypothetical protein Q4F34_09045, partial [Prevotellaceae bacterium]|nr:hypothetical protein [Prevotellaceae bacterium]